MYVRLSFFSLVCREVEEMVDFARLFAKAVNRKTVSESLAGGSTDYRLVEFKAGQCSQQIVRGIRELPAKR